MRVIKKLNNNFAICVDNEGKELIAYGKGIGFPKTPYEITDLAAIDRTFYDVDQKYLELFNELPEKVLHFTVKLVDIARNELNYELNPNIVLTLADHINFCIQRARQHIYVQMPLIYEVEQQYPQRGKAGAVCTQADRAPVCHPAQSKRGFRHCDALCQRPLQRKNQNRCHHAVAAAV